MALDAIRVVVGNELPAVLMTLTDEALDAVIDVSAVSTVVTVTFHLSGSTTTLSTITCTKPNGGADGIVRFDFTGGVLDVAAGSYAGDINIDFNGSVQTVYETLRFRVRAANA